MIDRMFQQEISNAELKSTVSIFFNLNFLFTTIFPCCCPINICLPKKYITPEKSGGDILEQLINNDHQILIMDEDLRFTGSNNDEHKETNTKLKGSKNDEEKKSPHCLKNTNDRDFSK